MSSAVALEGRPLAGRAEQFSTRLIFLLSGLATATWAPLVPFVKERLGNVDDGTLGLLILFIGLGSIVTMPLAGVITGQVGCRRVVIIAALLVVAVFPALASLASFWSMAIALTLFGAGMGCLDVAMNLHAVIVERDGGRPMMSGFHALYSVGGIIGATGVSAMLSTEVLSPFVASCLMSAAMLVLLLWSLPALLPYGDVNEERQPLFVLPKGSIVFVGILCFLALLSEGSVQDWSAVFLTSQRGADVAVAGMGYAAFATAMTIGRLAGNRLLSEIGEGLVLLSGGLLAAAGFATMVIVPNAWADVAGLFFVGFGLSNIVPVLSSVAGRDGSMPSSLAIASLTTLGYLGNLAGPAAIGFIARLTDLRVSFTLVAAAMLVISISSRMLKERPRAA